MKHAVCLMKLEDLNMFIVHLPRGAEGKPIFFNYYISKTNAKITTVPFKVLFNCTFMKILKTIGIPLATVSEYYIFNQI